MLKKLLPVMYTVRGQMVPARLTQAQRVTFVRGTGVPESVAVFLGTQDRAASLVSVLQVLIEKSGNEALLAQANDLVKQWNTECDEFLNTRLGR